MIRALVVAAGLLLPSLAQAAEPLANHLFGAAKSPSQQQAMPIGSYAKGCAAGLVAMPETGPSWQMMRLSRNRNYGHPEMIQFLVDLSKSAQKIGWAGLYIGDISQPRGGPMTSGHASHQIGLDADIWQLPPQRLNLTRQDREKISSIPVRSANQRSVTKNWTARHHAVMRAAALDPRVDRIFVAAAVKIEMCKTATKADTAWLQKIRPVAGHDTHFHVRLKCPAGSSACQPQTPSVKELSKGGNGCDETLTWWVTDFLAPPKKADKPSKPSQPVPRQRGPRDYIMADLPNQCKNVLASR